MTVTTTNQSITPDTRPVVAELNRFATRPEVLAALRRAKADAEKQLQRDPDLSTTFVALDPLQFGSATPDAIGSIRVVVTRDGGGDSLERHSNSTQYLFVLDGPVETHVESTDGWRVDRYGYGGATDRRPMARRSAGRLAQVRGAWRTELGDRRVPFRAPGER